MPFRKEHMNFDRFCELLDIIPLVYRNDVADILYAFVLRLIVNNIVMDVKCYNLIYKKCI